MADNMEGIKECVSCEEGATIVCFDCKNYYCEDCFNLMHKKKKSSKHKNEAISPILPIGINCLKHQGYQIVSFCLDDKGK
jgi:hypothetical protein